MTADTRKLAEQTADTLYKFAVAMHESISTGQGAVGWSDSKVIDILEAFAQSAADAARQEGRREALEEAAEIAECFDTCDGTCQDPDPRAHSQDARVIADKLHALAALAALSPTNAHENQEKK